MLDVEKGSVWLSSLASGKPYARGEMRSRDHPQLSKQYVSILSQNLRGFNSAKEAVGSSSVSPRDKSGPPASKRRGDTATACTGTKASHSSSPSPPPFPRPSRPFSPRPHYRPQPPFTPG